MLFFFQAEDGIRDGHVTGVQTCALPILCTGGGWKSSSNGYLTAHFDPFDPTKQPYDEDFHPPPVHIPNDYNGSADRILLDEIGRALCRESYEGRVGDGPLHQKSWSHELI